jgi:ribosome-binding factor A
MTPRLQFFYDSSLETGNRLLALIDSIKSDNHNS